jgi:hypothetical protein
VPPFFLFVLTIFVRFKIEFIENHNGRINMEPGNSGLQPIDDDGERHREMSTKKRAKKHTQPIEAGKRQRCLKGNIELAWIYVSQSFYVKDIETMNELLDDMEIHSATDFIGWHSGPGIRALASTLKDAYKGKFLSIFRDWDAPTHPTAVALPDDPSIPEIQVEEYVRAKMDLSRIIRGFDEKGYCFFVRSSGERVYIDENPGYIESQFKDGETLSLGRLFKGKYATFVTAYQDSRKPRVRQIFTPDFESDASSIDY